MTYVLAFTLGLLVTLLAVCHVRWRYTVALAQQKEEAAQTLAAALESVTKAQHAAEEALSTQKLVEEQLRQSQKLEAVGQLAGGIAHDFNNLLTVIRGHSELLSNAIDSADPHHAGICQIHEAARRAAVLTRQLLAFTRKQVLQPRVIDINLCIEHLSPILHRLIGEHIEFHLALGDDTSNIMADPGQIDQLLINLAVNARDAMPHGGTLSILTTNVDVDEHYTIQHEATVPGAYVLLSVSDTGHGMDTHTSARIFEPFFTTKPPGQGCGLGLSTVYGIVKQSGGYIWVYSEVDHGTTFKIYLPQAAAASGATELADHTGVPPTIARGGSEIVLLVEDDDALRSLVRQMLARHGYTVLDAANGREALHLAHHHDGRIDLVVTDLIMPEMGGRTLVDRLAALRPNLRSLFMSGYTDDDIVRRGMLESNVAFLQKPFTANGMLSAVRDVLDDAVAESTHDTY